MPPKKATAAEGAFHWNEEQSLKLVMLFLHTKDLDLDISGWDDFQPALESLFDDKVSQKSAKNQWVKLKKAYLENGGNEIKNLLKGAPSSADTPQAKGKGKGRKAKAGKKAEAAKLSAETVEISDDEPTQEVSGDAGKQDDAEMAADGGNDDEVETNQDNKNDGNATGAADGKDAEDEDNSEHGESDGEEDTEITHNNTQPGNKASEPKDKPTKNTDKPAPDPPKTSTTAQTKKRGPPTTPASGRQSKKPRCSTATKEASAAVVEQRKLNPGKSLSDFLV